jgi:hypothetical protein
MLKTLWTVTAAGLLALCMTGCGGGSDYPSKICDKIKSCDPTMTAADVTSCKQQASQGLSSVPSAQKDTVNKELDQCLAMSCSLFESCLTAVENQAGGTGGTGATGGTVAPSSY